VAVVEEVIVFGVDGDEVNRPQVEAVKHLIWISGHVEPVFVMAEIAETIR